MSKTPDVPYILLMEDNPLDVFLLETAFELAAISVHLEVAEDGVRGLEALEGARVPGRLPELVIVDYNMPRLDGMETLRRLREDLRWAGVKVVMLTTSGFHEAQARALEVVDYLVKPGGIDDARVLAQKLATHW